MAEAEQSLMADSAARNRPDYFGCFIGIAVFFGGLALLLVTFKLAYDMFGVAPETALGIDTKKFVDLNVAGTTFAWIVVRVLLLLVMSFIGSMIANRGIKLYLAGRRQMFDKVEKE